MRGDCGHDLRLGGEKGGVVFSCEVIGLDLGMERCESSFKAPLVRG